MKFKIKNIFLLLSISVSTLHASNQETDSLKKYVTPIASHHTDPKWEHTWGNNKWIRQKFKEDYYGVGFDPEAFYRKAMGGRNPIYVWNDSKKGFLTPKTTDFDLFLKPIIQLHASHTAYDATWGNLDWVKKQYYGNTYKVGFDPEVFYEKVMGGKKPFIHWDTSAANPISLYLAKNVNPYRDFIKKHKNVFFGEICSFRSVFENIGLRQLNRQFKIWLDRDDVRRYMTPVEAQYDLGVDLNRASSFDDKSIIKKMLEGWRLHQISVLGLSGHSPLFVDLFLARQSPNMKSFLITDPHLSLGNVAFLANNVAYYQHDLVFDFSTPLPFNNRDHDRLVTFFQDSLGHNPSEQFVALYNYVVGKSLSTSAGREFLKAAADAPYIENSYMDARYTYATILSEGGLHSENFKEASRYFEMAADQGHKLAPYSYVKMLRERGFRNNKTVRHYLKMSAEDLGIVEAIYDYIDLFWLQSEEKDRDLVPVRHYTRIAAEKGQAKYIYRYAHMLDYGIGGEKDPIAARRYYKRAADQGYSSSQYSYAVMLHNGCGGNRDRIDARRYFKLAADQGSHYSQYEYAIMLRDGLGGDEDLVEARRYFKLAADQESSLAQYRYAIMLRDGVGGNEDLVEAKRYFQLAVDKGHEQAKIAYDLLLAEDQNSHFKLVEDGSGSKSDIK